MRLCAHPHEDGRRHAGQWFVAAGSIVLLCLSSSPLLAHAVAEGDKGYIQEISGIHILPFVYLGAKHMVTGYDHLLFLLGVIFFLYRMKDILLYVTLFSLGHSTTLILGVLFDLGVSSHLVDMVIGLSVCWKAFDNLGGFAKLGRQPDNRIIVGGFGLIHGLGLATKLQALGLNKQGLLENLVAFNIGVEIGQVIALSLILVVMTLWRTTKSFGRFAVAANALLFLAGVVLAGEQLAGYFFSGGA